MTNPEQIYKRRLVAWSLAVMVVFILVACATPLSPPTPVEASSIPPVQSAPATETHAPAPAGTAALAQAEPDATLTPTAYFPVVTQRATLAPAPKFTNIIFLHHSVGANLIFQGNLYQKFHDLGYEFWDHDYNSNGMRRQTDTSPFYTSTGFIYNIPYDSTDITIGDAGLYHLFQQPLVTTDVPPLPQPCNIPGLTNANKAFSCLMRHDVIIIKSCYPNADIYTEEDLEADKTVYRMIADRAAQYPNKIFITLGFPPKNAQDWTNPDAAANARRFMDWLKTSPEVTGPTHPNFFVYDLFDQLAGSNNFLRPEYIISGSDSHPNELANQTIAPDLVKFVDDAIKAYSAASQ